MILEFSFSNYRSFKKEQTFSMILDGDEKNIQEGQVAITQKKEKVLKTAIIYGANASGKSNLMKAFQALRSLVVHSADKKPSEVFSQYEPFAFTPHSSQHPSCFDLYFLIDHIRYHYKVAILLDEVIEESLYYYPNGREAKLFDRKNNQYTYGDNLKGPKNTIEELTSKNQLFLSKAAQNNQQQLIPIYLFFEHQFMSIPFLDSWSDKYYIKRLAQEIEKNSDNQIFIYNFINLLRSFDTGLVNFKVQKLPFSDDYDIQVEHLVFDDHHEPIGTIFQPFAQESTGTQKLFVIGGLILRAIMNGRVIIIDEFERSLHPFISSFILQLFNHPKINTTNAQLIIATHDTNLLSKENNLRRDQIWMIEKDSIGASELFSLADMEGIRKDLSFEKWYLSGRFGGIPNIEALNFELNFKHETKKGENATY